MASLEEGNLYDLVIKYPVSFGRTKLSSVKLTGSFLGPSIIRKSINPDIDTIWWGISNEEASIDDPIKDMNINDLKFYVFTDMEENTIAIAEEWIQSYAGSGNDFKFEIKNITISQKLLAIKKLKELGITMVEL